MIAVRLRDRLARAAPGVEAAFSTRSRPIDLERGMREGRFDAAIDWLIPERGPFREITLFGDALVAVARGGHPALRRVRSVSDLQKGELVALRPRVEGEHPVAGIREWRRLELNYVLEVSEILEVFMVVAQSDLFGLIPQSMLRFGRDVFGLKPLQAGPRKITVPIRLIWHESRDADPAHAFLRRQIQFASNDVVARRAR